MLFVEDEVTNLKILEKSECIVGLKNPFFRVPQEQFCLESVKIIDKDKEYLDRLQIVIDSENLYTLNHLINIFLIGFCGGLVVAFCLYMGRSLTWKSEENGQGSVHDERMEKMQLAEIEMQTVTTNGERLPTQNK
mmetsp:Transcript_34260/g.25330  ORF Transcript_34260/g.25330 Transcript_34260/m.25330 type:complete len:135 (-) Transcript_34260:32-436(-)